MKCRYCGQEIPDGILYCEGCGEEVQIVPDYNPLDDMLAAHVKDSINNSGQVNYQRPVRGNTGRTAGRSATGRTIAGRNTSGRTNTGRNRGYGHTSARMADDREMRRRQAERRKALKKKKRRKALLILFFMLALIISAVVLLYINSYTGVVRSGNKALDAKEYTKAEEYFEKAVDIDDKKADAYIGLSKVLIAQEDLTSAESVFLTVLEKQKTNTELYEAAFQFYLDIGQPMGIPELLSDADDKVTEELEEYIVNTPEFSLDDEETYDDVQQLSLTSKEGDIYYTSDGSSVSPESTKYKEPIQLSEGSNTIKAIVVNKKGVPSQIVEKEYVIELPVEDAPAVSPSTGQYDYAESIEIKVPEGYTAYYTMDGVNPTVSSDKYTGPIDMPQGETLFKAILVSKSGRVSGVTTRNYVRE